MHNLFDLIPRSFFNYLSSGSQNRVYSDCLQVIYQEYERQISYRLPRNVIRDAVALYLLENHVQLEGEEEAGIRNVQDAANAVLRRFTDESVGWLEEETDDETYEKQIMMTERGVQLTEFLQSLRNQEKEEYAGYIINIYDLLNNPDIWKEHPYINGLKAIHKNARMLSGALKKLATYIRRIIERLAREETLESLTENLIEYLEGGFIREYARLTRQQNVHVYRSRIRPEMNRLKDDPDLLGRLTEDCMREENLPRRAAEDQVLSMVDAASRFLFLDYDRMMEDIHGKINTYLTIAVGRARFLRSREKDLRGRVERMIHYLVEETAEIGMKDELPEELQELFLVDGQQYMDEESLRYPRRMRRVTQETESEYAELDEADAERQLEEQRREAYDPFSRERSGEWLAALTRNRRTITAAEMGLKNQEDLLMALSAAAYAQENGFAIRVEEDFTETDTAVIRNFTISKKDG
ncbi:MAG: hypothetical protein IKE24_08425 [Clostridia bacterium]|nr:hypothetical protein [Clostridia bacterium]